MTEEKCKTSLSDEEIEQIKKIIQKQKNKKESNK